MEQKIKILISLCILIVVILGVCLMHFNVKKNELTIDLGAPPITADTYEYDYRVHHAAFTSVLSTLLTTYKLGTYQPVLAKSWEASTDYKTWTFHLRDDLTFSNGDLISPQIVLSSLKRMALLQKKNESHSGLFEHLVGVEKLVDLTSELPGLILKGNDLVITFNSPVDDLLAKISFGLYGIVHPNNYDQKDGHWISAKEIISSGGYKVDSWSDKEIILSLRNDFKTGLSYPHRAQKIKMIWKESKDADIFLRSSIQDKPIAESELQFFGPVANSVSYIRVNGHKDSQSLLASKRNRQILRDQYLAILESQKVPVVRSFFPLTIPKVKELYPTAEKTLNIGGTKKISYAYGKGNPPKSHYARLLLDSFKQLAQKDNLDFLSIDSLKYDEIKTDAYEGKDKPLFDFYNSGTTFLIEEADSSIRFMFLSKEGIRLPDEDGRLVAEVKKPVLDIQKINEIIWDQALIWPITHNSSGFWANEKVNVEQLNTLYLFGDFNWVGVK